MAKQPIKAPAIKEKKTGKVIKAPSKAWSHTELETVKQEKKKDVKEGFVTSKGSFVDRKTAAKLAESSGEVKTKAKKLHSTDLRKAAGIKKKVLK